MVCAEYAVTSGGTEHDANMTLEATMGTKGMKRTEILLD